MQLCFIGDSFVNGTGDGIHPYSKGYAALAGLIGGWDAWRGWFAG